MAINTIVKTLLLIGTLTNLSFAVPAGFNIQGRLTDANGVNRNGAFIITFSIFRDASGPAAEWQQRRSVSVTNGNFQVDLQGRGDGSTPGDRSGPLIEDAVQNLPDAYVQIQVAGEAPLVPRQHLLRSPFPSVNLVGAVMFFAGATCPPGWHSVDGSTLSKTGIYSELFEYLKYTYGGSGDNFVLPNMSDGPFIRAVGGNAAALGHKQSDAFQGHIHKVMRRNGDDPNGWGFNDARVIEGPNRYDYHGVNHGGGREFDLVAENIETDGQHGQPRTGSETRVFNYAMTPCVKY